MNIIRKKVSAILIVLSICLIASVIFTIGLSQSATAAATITVNSTGVAEANDGTCTLPEATIAANTDTASGAALGECVAGSGTDTIAFNIAGAGVKTIATGILNVTEPVTIDGYTQPGASANTTVAPNPFDAVIKIEVVGQILIYGNANGSTVKGLSIYGATNNAGIFIQALNVKVQGNYIGPDASGGAQGNCRGVEGSNGGNSGDHSGDNALIGGLNPEDRNVISGNNTCTIASGGYPNTGWVYQGNYIGIAPDGVNAMPNSDPGGSGSGGLSIDYADDVVIGGDAVGAANVISGNYNMGLAPDQTANLTVSGNYIGTDYTGTVAVPNGGGGISSGYNTGLVIGGSTELARNIISGNDGDGIFVNSGVDFRITGNYIGVDKNGALLGNTQTGVLVFGGATGIVGGIGAGEGNIIAGTTSGFGLNITNSSYTTIVGNSIHDNFGVGIGFDADNKLNDAGDPDTGSNDYLNFPDNAIYHETGGNTIVDYSLDVPAGSYRVEFYTNTTGDGSGYGEGETFLAFQNVKSTGTGSQSFSKTLTGTSIPNISKLALTATLIDANRPSGFRMTSEFSPTATPAPDVTDLSLTKTLANPQDVTVGATLHYNVTLTNGGYTSIALAQFDGSFSAFNALFTDVLPPELTFVDNTNPDITCTNTGTALPTLIAANHADYNGILCTYTGSGQTLAEGESITDTLNVTVNNDSDLVFTNYAFTGLPQNDPDRTSMGSILGGAAGNGGAPDAIDEFISSAPNNFALASFPIPVEQQPSSETTTATGILASTGLSVILVTIVGMVSTIVGSLVFRRNRSHSRV